MATLEEVLPTVDDTTLDQDDDLADVKAALEPAAAKWRDIGAMFRLKGGDLDTIGATHPGNPSACMFDVEKYWLKKNYNVGRFGPPTWRKIVEAVWKSAGGGNPDHALKIAKEHKIEGASSQASATPKPQPPPAATGILQKRPEMVQIKLLKYKDDQGKTQRLRILEKFALQWKEVGEILGISNDHLLIIKDKQKEDPKKCAEDMVQKWLQSGEVTWGVFLEALEDVELSNLAEDVREALPTMIN